ncbi:hypothetical protein EHS39_36250 [Ensifer sp. MPMI2T]|nr:hypothetical protein EHS39_36250 [Ensifer sp. MPMI2T]
MVSIRFAVALTVLLLASNARADQTFIVCDLTRSADEKGVLSAITGTDVFMIDPQPDGSTTYTVPPGCRADTLVTKVSDTELMFECEHAVAKGFRYLMTIDRVSGEYEKMFWKKTASGSSGLVHFGHCAPRKRQF